MRRIVVGLALGAVLTLVAGPAALADAPAGIGAAQLADRAGVLTDAQESSARDEIQAYDDATGDDLRIVFVNTFTDPSDRSGWAVATAKASGIDGSALVLAVAVQARQFGYATSSTYPLDHARIDDVAASALKPTFGEQDWAGGITAFTKDLTAARTSGGTDDGSSSGDGAPVEQEPDASGSSGFAGVAALFVIAILIALVIAIVLVVRRSRAVTGAARGPAPVGPPPVDQRELDRRASRALVALDDELTTSDQELGFAVAEFGDDAAAPFATALQDARAKSREAFSIRQRLDDADPETPDEKRRMTERIIALCDQAGRGLAAQKQAFDELRRLEQQLPTAVPAARTERDRLAQQAAVGSKALETVRGRFGDAAVHGAADDLGQANDLLELAGTALDTAGKPGSGGEAVIALRSGQQALAQASALLAGLVAAPADFMATKQRLDAAIEDTRNDIAEAERVPDAGRAVTSAVAAARAAVDAADLQSPSAGLAAVAEANGRLDQAMAPVRDRAAQRSRAVSALPRTIDAARNSIRDVRRYIDSRRGGVGSEARTRISEAQDQLDRAVALQDGDPVEALAAAQRAQQLANAAWDAAQRDVDDFRNGFGGGGGLGGGSGFGGAFGGAVLGGVLGGILSGGGGGGGGWSAGGGFGAGGDYGGGGGGGFGGGGGDWSGGGGSFGGGDGGGGSF